MSKYEVMIEEVIVHRFEIEVENDDLVEEIAEEKFLEGEIVCSDPTVEQRDVIVVRKIKEAEHV